MMLIDDAIREFEVAAQDPKRECVCRSMIGMIEIERGRMNEAIDAFLMGLNSPNKDPQQETVLCYEIGACYEAKKLNKDALSYYQTTFLREIPAASVDAVEVKSLERDFVGTDNEPGSEMDHVVYIRYRTDKVEED